MLAPVLTVKEISEWPKVNMGLLKKANKEKGNYYAQPVSRMLWNYPEGSRVFSSLTMDIKASLVTKEGKITSDQKSCTIPSLRVRFGILTPLIQKETTDSDEKNKNIASLP